MPQVPTIGLCVPHLADNYGSSILHGLHTIARRRPARIVVARTSPERLVAAGLALSRVDGWIVALDGAGVAPIVAAGTPVVAIGAAPDLPEVPVVLPDNIGGARAVAAHLLAHGHTRVAFCGHLGQSDIRQRYEGYRQALVAAGLDPAAQVLIDTAGNSEQTGRVAARQLIDMGLPCTAIMAGTDQGALGLLSVLGQVGYRVPEHLAVVGFNDSGDAEFATPPLTTVRQQLGAQVALAAELLFAQLAGAQVAGGPHYVPAVPVIRQSCGCGPRAAGHDPARIAASETWQDELALALAGLAAGSAGPADPSAPGLWTGAAVVASALATALHGEELPDTRALEAAWRQAVELQADSESLEQIGRLVERVGLLRAAARPDAAEAALRVETLTRLVRGAVRRSLWEPVRDRTSRYQQLVHLNTAINSRLKEQGRAGDLEWVAATTLRYGCLALWDAPDGGERALLVRDCYGREAAPALAPGERVAPALFPPRKALAAAQADDGAGVVIVQPLSVAGQELGYLALWGTPPEDLHFNAEGSDSWAQLLSLALERAAMVATLTEARRVAEEADRLKSRFLSMVSHELRTPLGLIGGLSETLLAHAGEVVEPCRRDLEQIDASARYLNGLVRDVLDLARSQMGQLGLAPAPLELSELLRDVAATGERLAGEQGLTWETAIAPGLPRVYGDRTRLQQVLVNLVNNAVRYTEAGYVRLGADADGERVQVWVSDSGLGVPANEQEAIFGEFHQSALTSGRGFGGMGLGLAISRRLAELHGGALSVRSPGEGGAGSTFTLTLPALAEGPGEAGAGATVLLLAEAGAAAPVAAYLARAGYVVERADPEGEAWLERLRGGGPGAVVLDRALAERRGWELLRQVRAHPDLAETSVLFYALDAEGGAGALLELDQLAKPAGRAALAAALGRLGLPGGTDEGKTILVADDDPGLLDLHTRRIQAHAPGYKVLQAHDGREALALLRTCQVDLLLLDLMMPELDGFGVLAAMRELPGARAVPVIVLTAQSLDAEDMTRLNSAVVAVLGKGLFGGDELLGHIGAALGRGRRLGGEARRIVRLAMSAIHTGYAEPLALDDLARQVGVSQSYLDRCFQQELGLSPKTYLTRHRLREAKRLLRSGAMNVTEVAMAVGFSSAAYFSRVFQREVGVAPDAYRRGAGEGAEGLVEKVQGTGRRST